MTAITTPIQEIRDPRHDRRRACREHPDPEIFDPISPGQFAEAVTVCASCPIVDSCGEWALCHREWGVWGGLLFENGQLAEPNRGLAGAA